MKIILLLIVCFVTLIFVSESKSQIHSILDSKYGKFYIGFKIHVNANVKTKISLTSEDSLYNIVLYDSLVSQSQEIIFLQEGSNFESEKTRFPEYIVYSIPIIDSGIYYLRVEYNEKMFFIK